VLCHATRYFSQAHPPKMMYPLIREMAAITAPLSVPVPVAGCGGLGCGVLGFRKQPYDKWLKYPGSHHDWDDAHLIKQARYAHEEYPEAG
jgi:putative transposase